LLQGLFQQRFELNRNYLMKLSNDNLLRNFYLEAGLWSSASQPEQIHWGWESPTCQVRGHFLGHWLSGAARSFAATGDSELKAKADRIVAELGRCQKENGGEWAGSVPAQYLNWIARGKTAWAPHYTLHKTIMGLYDMFAYGGNQQALDILTNFARWFYRWSEQFSREQMDDILDWETGGMLEVWANLYGVTRQPEHLELLQRYERRRLFDRLLRGEDALTNRHANTTIPEAQGMARTYEVTGDARYRQAVEAYWDFAVTRRGTFCTGGQNAGEIWTPPFAFSTRLGDKNQEHCTVYNMIRLADYLLRWTGDAAYSDYIERNLYNGVLAQQHPRTGMITYFLPLAPGSQKKWGSETDDFWCCHGSLVQAHTLYPELAFYQDSQGLLVSQYIPSQLSWARPEGKVSVAFDPEINPINAVLPDNVAHRPQRWMINLVIKCAQPQEFTLKLRLPGWLADKAVFQLNGQDVPVASGPSSYVTIRRTWQDDSLRLELPKALWTDPIPDAPDMVAFMDGPVVLAGLIDEERTLHGSPDHPEELLIPDNERQWGEWLPGYRTCGQEHGFRFIPLLNVVDEKYTVYFPIKP
jgi:DUF1680 family protein